MPQMMPIYWVFIFFVSLLFLLMFVISISSNVLPAKGSFLEKSLGKVFSWLK
nr:ATP synthase F0 subunit 8 [Megaginus tataupensis]